MTTIASVYRFRDQVAVHVGDGSTTYLEPKEADQLAKALRLYAKDVRQGKFVDSPLGTAVITRED